MKDREATNEGKSISGPRPCINQPWSIWTGSRIAERDKIAQELARYIGMRPDQVDRKTLVVHVSHYLPDFFDGDKTKVLSGHDTRELEGTTDLGSAPLVDRYVRDELGLFHGSDVFGPRDGYMRHRVIRGARRASSSTTTRMA